MQNHCLAKFNIQLKFFILSCHEQLKFFKKQEDSINVAYEALFKKYKSDISIGLNQIKDLSGEKDQAVNLRGLLKKVCPAFNYIKIDDQHELIVCGAYMNRMALGGIRLHEVCETLNHLNCEYFVSPRIVP